MSSIQSFDSIYEALTFIKIPFISSSFFLYIYLKRFILFLIGYFEDFIFKDFYNTIQKCLFAPSNNLRNYSL